MFVTFNENAIVGAAALAAKNYGKQGFRRVAGLRSHLGQLQVPDAIGFDRRPNGVATGEKLVKPKRENWDVPARFG